MTFIPEDVIAQIIDRCDIVELVTSYVPLKKAGRNFKANCPFHHEKTPSFVVNPDKQIFHCFGCGVGGNVVSFVMKQERLEFPEAIRLLAQKANIEIPENISSQKRNTGFKDEIFKVNQLACDYFHAILLSDKSALPQMARDYLKKRDMSFEMVKTFSLGFALDEWSGLLNYLKSKGVSLQLMEKAGLIIAREGKEGYYDRFRGRIIFPIFDAKGQCRAFGARVLEGLKDAKQSAGAKYINSPETEVYTKGQYLYGFHLAKDEIIAKDCVIIVEGYVDCIAPFQSSVKNVVASLGTALTVEQIRFLHRYTKNVIFLYDADPAGEAAMMRSLDILIDEGMEVKIARLAQNEDPDSFIKKFGKKAFEECILTALTLFDFKLRILIDRYSVNSLEGKAKIVSEMLPTINRFQHAVLRSGYIKKLSQVLLIPEQSLIVESRKIKSGDVTKKDESANSQQQVASHLTRTVERNILRLVMEEESFIQLMKEDVLLADFQDNKIRQAVSKIFELFEQGKEVAGANLIQHFEDVEMQTMIASLMADETLVMGDQKKMYQDCVNRIKQDRQKKERQELLEGIREAERIRDFTRLGELTKIFNQSVKS